jgi:hypothetical protein
MVILGFSIVSLVFSVQARSLSRFLIYLVVRNVDPPLQV